MYPCSRSFLRTSFLVLCSAIILVSSKNYILEKTEILNGKPYVTQLVQPFYRVHHEHEKLPMFILEGDDSDSDGEDETKGASEAGPKFRIAEEPRRRGHPSDKKKKPLFGTHELPAEDIEKYKKPSWPEPFAKYAHCLDIPCSCPYYDGNVVNGSCVLPSGKILGKALRKDFRTYTPEEKRKFEEALNEMKRIGLYNEIGKMHKYGGIHSGPAFLPWHREMIKRLEMAFRKFYPDLGLPYWDSTLDNNLPEPKDSVWFSDYLMGDTDDDGYVVTGKYAYWKTLENKDAILRILAEEPDGEFFNDARVDWVVDQTEIDRVMAYSSPLVECENYTLDDRFLEYSHDYVHYYINGDMFTKYGSSNDPIFFMHHGMIDLVWEEWRQKRQTREQRENDYPADRHRCAPSYHFRNAKMSLLEPFRNIDGCSNKYTDNMYEYAPRPTCTNLDLNCRSEFLFCDNVTNDSPKCSAKVKLGGNCSGFEGIENACYKGKCVKGRCVTTEQLKKREKTGKFM
ncbi:hypothetical protein QR680_002354 [Steinernema hermaphroditum]|uniref:Tyrosinase copper-binding domain-containing protein n=1 Tax=Steinernema hermaphroditum TaxID=289476 RepID=A0AA39LHK4_9BILA|nr:hypothetical protein QR680_002354 [Steinernema hermaphroditum]